MLSKPKRTHKKRDFVWSFQLRASTTLNDWWFIRDSVIYGLLFFGQDKTQLAHDVLRTICFLTLGERVVVLWLFFMQPSHNFLGMVQDSYLALEHSLFSWNFITSTERFLKVQTRLHFTSILDPENVLQLVWHWECSQIVQRALRNKVVLWEFQYFSKTFPTGFLVVVNGSDNNKETCFKKTQL